MVYRLVIAVVSVSAMSFNAFAGTNKAISIERVAQALRGASAGDTILIADGDYHDVELKWRSPGCRVTVMAENPGKVVVDGNSSLRMAGDSLTVSGIDFINAHPSKGSVVEFRIADEVADNSRLTDCYFYNCNPKKRDTVSSYIVLHGRNNRVDHCSLTGKKNLGVTLLVNLNDERSLRNNHRIDHNYFGPRPVYGSNGAETMRIGTSQQAYETSATIVEDNLFDRCNGEVEIISVKSSDNIIRNNIFNECEGVVALRHGKRNIVEGNRFNGHSRRNTGGVRVVDSGHKVKDNIFCELAGGRFFSALALMNSVPNSLPNRYVQVSDVDVSGNTFINCENIEFGTGRDMERTEAPRDCRFTDNIVVSRKESPITFIDPAADIKISGTSAKAPAYKPVAVENLRPAYGASCFSPMSETALSPDTIRLPKGVVYRSEPFVITRPTVIIGDATVLRWNGSKGDNFITIADGGSLKVSGVTFDGALQRGCATVRNGIATATQMIMPYNLNVEKCSFINMPESGCCGIRGTKGTFAEVFTVTDCYFADLSGNGISLADETDDKGRYSADDITISDCRFNHMLGIPVNIYRGGSDESTAGPYVNITGCTFTDCCNRERGSVLRLIGPQKLYIAGCTFDGSGRGGASVRLDETTWEDVAITDCSWNNSGRVISNRDVVR